MRPNKLFFALLSLSALLGMNVLRAESGPVISAMNEAIQDEYRARTTYKKVIDTFGEVRPFINIVRAEAQHIRELSVLFENRRLPVPRNRWTFASVPSYESIGEACRGGIESELHNIAMYDRLLDQELPSDVQQVFENLRSASLERHLPAFRRCAERRR